MEERHQHKQKTRIQQTSALHFEFLLWKGKGNIKILWKGQLHQISCLDFRSYKRPLPKAIPWNSHERSSLFNHQILDRVMKSIFFIYICTLHYIYDYCILHFWKTFLILSHLECSSHIGRFLNDSSVNVKTLKIKLSKN